LFVWNFIILFVNFYFLAAPFEGSLAKKTTMKDKHHYAEKTLAPSTSLPMSSTLNTSHKQLEANSEDKNTNVATLNQNAKKGNELIAAIDKQNRHLPSPLKNRSGGLSTKTKRYGVSLNAFSLETFTSQMADRDTQRTVASEEFDDILTITTENDKTESDVVLDCGDINDRLSDYTNFLKPPLVPVGKTSLINRFLDNVTKKKMAASSIRTNTFFTTKLNNERLFGNELFVPGVKLKDHEPIENFNAEVALELKASTQSSTYEDVCNRPGLGEISPDLFKGKPLPILRGNSEKVCKVSSIYFSFDLKIIFTFDMLRFSSCLLDTVPTAT